MADLKNGLEQICPVWQLIGSWEPATHQSRHKGADTPGMELTGSVNRELTDVTSFCACLANIVAGADY